MKRVPGVFPPNARVMIIGQAPGRVEVSRGRPFVGPSGKELDRWLVAAGLVHWGIATTIDECYHGAYKKVDGVWWTVDRSTIAFTNVWQYELPDGGIDAMTATRRELKAEGASDPTDKPLSKGRYLRASYDDRARLADEITAASPNLVIALGNEALWATSGDTGIEARRGALYHSTLGPKAIATFHPSFILRGGYRHRALAIADLIKAQREITSPDLHFPRRELWVDPTLLEIDMFCIKYIQPDTPYISIDIETGWNEITSVAFAPSPMVALCIPFVQVNGRTATNYWNDPSDEVTAWKFVRAVCESPIPKLLQNGLYDLYWLWVKRRIRVRNYLHDTRLEHHALFPELPKRLGFMGSLWENESAWKLLAARHSSKRDDE